MGLKVVAESRTGDTGVARKARQRVKPPDILLTTPEQLALFCAWEGARLYFEDLRCVILDEVHAIWPSKRGDLLNLQLARLQTFAPGLRRVGLSATVDDPDQIRRWITPTTAEDVDLVRGAGGAAPIVDLLLSEGQVPWAGHTAQHAMPEVYEAIKQARTALVFVNTRFQAEFAVPGAVAAQRGQPAHCPSPRFALRRAAAQGRGGDGRGGSCGRLVAPRRSTWASTGATWIW